MKRFILNITFLFFILPTLYCQKVDSIKVEQAGDFIKIHYKIVGSTIYQIFNVRLLCSMNKGLKTELRSVTGDVGEGILGGKQDYVILWDVFKDVDELKSVEFFVRSELIKDNTKVNLSVDESLLRRKIYIMAACLIDGESGHFGARFAHMDTWGFSVKFLIGKRFTFSNPETFISPAAGLDLTKRIIKNPEYQLHLLVGVTAIKLKPHLSLNEDPRTFLTYDLGLIFARKRFLMSTALSSVKDSKVASFSKFIEIGLGVKF